MILVSSLTYKISVKQRSCVHVNSPSCWTNSLGPLYQSFSEDELGEGRVAAIDVASIVISTCFNISQPSWIFTWRNTFILTLKPEKPLKNQKHDTSPLFRPRSIFVKIFEISWLSPFKQQWPMCCLSYILYWIMQRVVACLMHGPHPYRSVLQHPHVTAKDWHCAGMNAPKCRVFTYRPQTSISERRERGNMREYR